MSNPFESLPCVLWKAVMHHSARSDKSPLFIFTVIYLTVLVLRLAVTKIDNLPKFYRLTKSINFPLRKTSMRLPSNLSSFQTLIGKRR